MSTPFDRPARGETAEYYDRYIDLVPDGDVRQLLDEQHRQTLAFLRSVDPARATHAYAAGKWSIAEVAGHLIDAERLYAMRAFWFARGHRSPLPGYESDEVVKISHAGERDWSSLVDEFDAVRRSTVAFFRYLPDDAWLRSGIASDMPFTVRALAYIAAGHVIHHAAILRERYGCG